MLVTLVAMATLVLAGAEVATRDEDTMLEEVVAGILVVDGAAEDEGVVDAVEVDVTTADVAAAVVVAPQTDEAPEETGASLTIATVVCTIDTAPLYSVGPGML